MFKLSQVSKMISETFEAQALLGKMLACPKRLLLLEALRQHGSLAVETLSQKSGLTIANTSQHLNQMKKAGLLRSQKEGKQNYYMISDGPYHSLIDQLHKAANYQHQKILDFLETTKTDKDKLAPITQQELVNALLQEDVILLDVRDTSDFHKGALPKAINIPVAELEQHLNTLPKNKKIIAYCQGPHCVLSEEALQILSKNRISARHYKAGYKGWLQAGLALERRH